MPSSITLTVSRLPVSTSFFLSALQPLDYAYRGRSENAIGFGSATNSSDPPDFWISQEMPGIPAGAAHVAFRASSRRAVQHFFTAALKAGGNIHGEPGVRVSYGYYSAVVIDFDGNSIEAVFRPQLSTDQDTDFKSSLSSVSTAAFPLKVESQNPPQTNAFKDRPTVSRLMSSKEATPSGPKICRDVFENIVSEGQSAANIARGSALGIGSGSPGQDLVSPSSPPANGSTSGIVGALLGVAAGAALHYAFTHDKDHGSGPSVNAYLATERTSTYLLKSNTAPRNGNQHITLEDNDVEDHASTIRPACNTLKSSTHYSHHGSRPKSINSTSYGSSTSKKTTRRFKAVAATPESITDGSSLLSSLKKTTPSPHSTTLSRHSSSTAKNAYVSSRSASCSSQAMEAGGAKSTTTTSPSSTAKRMATTNSKANKSDPPASTATDRSCTSREIATSHDGNDTKAIVLPLSEANLAQAATTITAISADVGAAKKASSDKAKAEEGAVSTSSRNKSGRGAGSGHGDTEVKGRLGPLSVNEVRPEESISLVGSVRSRKIRGQASGTGTVVRVGR